MLTFMFIVHACLVTPDVATTMKKCRDSVVAQYETSVMCRDLKDDAIASWVKNHPNWAQVGTECDPIPLDQGN